MIDSTHALKKSPTRCSQRRLLLALFADVVCGGKVRKVRGW